MDIVKKIAYVSKHADAGDEKLQKTLRLAKNMNLADSKLNADQKEIVKKALDIAYNKIKEAEESSSNPAKSRKKPEKEKTLLGLASKLKKEQGMTWKEAMAASKKHFEQQRENIKKVTEDAIEKLKKQIGTAAFESATHKTDVPKDMVRPAAPKGKRIVRHAGFTTNGVGKFPNKVGSTYIENRANRTDVNQPSNTVYPKLAEGGVLEDYLKPESFIYDDVDKEFQIVKIVGNDLIVHPTGYDKQHLRRFDQKQVLDKLKSKSWSVKRKYKPEKKDLVVGDNVIGFAVAGDWNDLMFIDLDSLPALLSKPSMYKGKITGFSLSDGLYTVNVNGEDLLFRKSILKNKFIKDKKKYSQGGEVANNKNPKMKTPSDYKYKVVVYHGGEMPDETHYAKTLEEAQDLSMKGEYGEITEIATGKMVYRNGGDIAKGNYDMMIRYVKEIHHHANELGEILKTQKDIDAWVVAKGERASTDLSEITHFLDASKDIKYAKGGTTTSLSSVNKKYLKNEDENRHSENIVLLAKSFGDADDLKLAKEILRKHNEDGGLSSENGKKRQDLHLKLITIARKEFAKQGIKFAKGGEVGSEHEFVVTFQNSETGKLLKLNVLGTDEKNAIENAYMESEFNEPHEVYSVKKFAKGGEVGNITPALNRKVSQRAQEIYLKEKGKTSSDFDNAFDKAIIEFGYKPSIYHAAMQEIGPEYGSSEYAKGGGVKMFTENLSEIEDAAKKLSRKHGKVYILEIMAGDKKGSYTVVTEENLNNEMYGPNNARFIQLYGNGKKYEDGGTTGKLSYWNQQAADLLNGKTIEFAGYATGEQAKKLGLEKDTAIIVAGDKYLIPLADDEGNDSGTLYVQQPNGAPQTFEPNMVSDFYVKQRGMLLNLLVKGVKKPKTIKSASYVDKTSEFGFDSPVIEIILSDDTKIYVISDPEMNSVGSLVIFNPKDGQESMLPRIGFEMLKPEPKAKALTSKGVENDKDEDMYVAVGEKDGYWTIISRPSSKESAQKLLDLPNSLPRGEVGKVVSVEDAKKHKLVIGREYLEPAKTEKVILPPLSKSDVSSLIEKKPKKEKAAGTKKISRLLVSGPNANYLPKENIEFIKVKGDGKIDGSDLLDGAYIKK